MAESWIVCPVSEFPYAEELPGDGDFRRIRSRPFGAVYRLSGTASVPLENLAGREVARLGTWIIDQRNLGVVEPYVTSSVIDVVVAAPSLSVAVRVRRFYQYLGQRLPGLGTKLLWSSNTDDASVREADANKMGGKLWTESVTPEELTSIVEYANAQGRLTQSQSAARLGLSIEGWQHLEDINQSIIKSNQGFVAMWFGHDVASAYQDGIAPAIRDAGYVPMRIDQKEHANRIDDEIIAEIRRSRFIVADFTCGIVDDAGKPVAIPRGGVYYEAGFAQGLGIPVIWMCRQDHIDHVHFDTRQFNHITWTDAADLREKLKNRIGAVLGDGPHVVR